MFILSPVQYAISAEGRHQALYCKKLWICISFFVPDLLRWYAEAAFQIFVCSSTPQAERVGVRRYEIRIPQEWRDWKEWGRLLCAERRESSCAFIKLLKSQSLMQRPRGKFICVYPTNWNGHSDVKEPVAIYQFDVCTESRLLAA